MKQDIMVIFFSKYYFRINKLFILIIIIIIIYLLCQYVCRCGSSCDCRDGWICLNDHRCGNLLLVMLFSNQKIFQYIIIFYILLNLTSPLHRRKNVRNSVRYQQPTTTCLLMVIDIICGMKRILQDNGFILPTDIHYLLVQMVNCPSCYFTK